MITENNDPDLITNIKLDEESIATNIIEPTEIVPLVVPKLEEVSETNVISQSEKHGLTVEETVIVIEEEKVKGTNTIQSEQPFTLTDSDHKPVHKYYFSLPSVNLKDLNAKLSKFNNLEIDQNDPSIKNWKSTVENSVEFYTVGNMYQDRFNDTSSHFKQGVEDTNQKLNSISSFKFKKMDGEIKGELALLKVSTFLGLGDIINVPLPHSGLWVTLKPPAEKDLIDFYNSLFRDKISLGRTTSGLTLSNFSVYINDRLVDFIIKHIHSVNFSDINKEELKKYILIHDLPILAWGFACTMYPSGFSFQRSCINDLEKCSYVAKADINMTKLLWIDNSSLTASQKLILSEYRPNKLTIENYHKFKAEHSKVVSTYFTTKNGIKFHLRVPTIAEYSSDGLAWINKINSNIEYVVMDESSREAEEKEEMLTQYVKSSLLRQYNHFIDYIELDENTINDRETINSLLEALSADDDVRTDFLYNVNKFINDTTIGIIGIPEYDCPVCKTKQNTEPVNEKLVNVIPMDVINLFFQLITLRIARILEREI
ncbi:MAG: hypothetical protein ACD_33C00004G0002 [uncultured bacterium]|nr:MAG: hypothetical protein ACD_33C00004G0002 [uncultured bacterium]